MSVVPVKFCVSASTYPSNVTFCFLWITLYGVFVFAVYTGANSLALSNSNVLDKAVSPSDHAKSYPGLATAFAVISVPYGYVPSSVEDASIYVLSVIENAYVSLSYM